MTMQKRPGNGAVFARKLRTRGPLRAGARADTKAHPQRRPRSDRHRLGFHLSRRDQRQHSPPFHRAGGGYLYRAAEARKICRPRTRPPTQRARGFFPEKPMQANHSKPALNAAHDPPKPAETRRDNPTIHPPHPLPPRSLPGLTGGHNSAHTRGENFRGAKRRPQRRRVQCFRAQARRPRTRNADATRGRNTRQSCGSLSSMDTGRSP